MKSSILLLAMTLASCSTPYQQAPSESNWIRRGYSEVQISSDIYEVSFRAASPEEERARDFVLLRSAEICQSRHLPYFSILADNIVGGEITSTMFGLFRNTSPLSVKNRVLCLRENVDSQVLETATVLESMRSKYDISRS